MAKRKTTTPSKPRATSKPKASPSAPKEKSPLQMAVTEAGFIIGQLRAHLKNAQITFLKIGALLVDVRDRKRYEVLRHENLEDFAWVRLKMKKSALYTYIRVYEWVKAQHPEWLERPVKGAIPDLTDIADLILIEKELTVKDLDPDKKKSLENLREKALAGDLLHGELAALRQRTRRGRNEGSQAYLRALRALRTRGARMPKTVPPKVIGLLDAAIELMALPEVNVVAARHALIWLSTASDHENLSQNT